MLNSSARLAFALVAACIAACASSPQDRLARMYRDYEREVSSQDGPARISTSTGEREQERADAVREMAAQNQLETGADFLKAAVLLVESDDALDLDLAVTLARRAADLGEKRGLRVAAEGIDKQLVKQAMHQLYGTQYVLDRFSQRWKLYPIDPRTTDADRAAMGVEPLAELVAKEALLNERFRKPTPYELATKKSRE